MIATYIGRTYSWIKLRLTKGEVITDPNELVKWLHSNQRAFIIFGTDVIPIEVYNPDQPKSPLLEFINNGGKVIWIGDIPFYYIDINGEKKVNDRQSPLPFNLNYFQHLPKSKEVRNTLVGEILKYKPKDSWRPVNTTSLTGMSVKDIIPIALTENNEASAWIFKIGMGYFIRLFDTPDMSDEDEDYVLQIPEKFENLYKVNAIRLKNVRIFDDVQLNLGKINVLVGDNGSGKTTILESIAMITLHMDEISKSRNISQNLLTTTMGKNYSKNYSIEGLLGKDLRYFLVLNGSNLITQNANVMYFVPSLLSEYERIITEKLTNFESYNSLRKEIGEILKIIDGSFDDIVVFNFDEKAQIFISKQDKSLIRLEDLGRGLSSLIILSVLYILEKPEILLIDDIESMGLFPLRLETLKSILSKFNSIIIISTQSLDVISILSLDDNTKFFLLSGGKIKELNAKDVRLFLESNEDIRIVAKNLIYEIGIKG